MTGYEKLKQMKKQIKCNIPELLALASQHDPFYAGSKTQSLQAEWFANLWEKFGYTSGIHLRRIHYQIVSEAVIKKHNGELYENTDKDWKYLNACSRYARYLKLVDATAFVDKRNPDPHIFRAFESNGYVNPTWYITQNYNNWEVPTIGTDLKWNLDWSLPQYEIKGYEYIETLQPYHIEIWEEKSTMDDILIPLCKKYYANLVTGIGFQSITSVLQLIDRVICIQKPIRIFYISDFDPAGVQMPVQVSRQIEYWLDQKNLQLDIQLCPIVLIHEQVREYQLPRVPIKETDKRKSNFEDTFGTGAVELDALEALHPGELKKIVEGHILEHRDEDLQERLNEAKNEANDKLEEEWILIEDEYEHQLNEIQENVESIVERYQERLEELSAEMEDDLGPYKNSLNSLWQDVKKSADDIEIDLPDKPTPENNTIADNWLFDSSRDYFEQLKHYRLYKTSKS